MAGKLSIVGTSIGNLGDITRRAVEVLGAADTILAEDTRVTGKLLAALGIEAHLERCDENVMGERAPQLVERMLAGEHLAFCSDAGMPGVSDPGTRLVDACREAGVPVEVLPGASAVTTALVAAGFNGTAFYFGGFLPRKEKAIRDVLQTVSQLDAALVFYESPHRVEKTVNLIADVMGERPTALCRELTKLHEEVLRLPAGELAENLAARESIKGEIVLVIAPPSAVETAPADLDDPAFVDRIRRELEAGVPKTKLAKQLAKETGLARSDIYSLILTISQ